MDQPKNAMCSIKSLSPSIMVEDVEEAISFYQNMLGFELALKVPHNSKPDWALLRNGQINLMCQSRRSVEGDLLPLRGKLTGGTVAFYCQVDNVEELYDHLLGKVKILKTLEKTFYGATEFTLQDPYGYIFTFSQDQ